MRHYRKWHDIQRSTPVHGQKVLITKAGSNQIDMALFLFGRFHRKEFFKPTHWMPLPETVK